MTPKERILETLKGRKGELEDNAYRAKAAFRNCTPEQMQQLYGQSSFTREEILNGYLDGLKEIDATIAYAEERL